MSLIKGEDWPPSGGRDGANQNSVAPTVRARKGSAPAEVPSLPSIIGPDLVVIGDLRSEGPVQIEGRIEGDVDSPSVIVGEDAYVDGSVSAEKVRILGAVAGWVRAAKVSIAETGRVDGCIQHQELVSETPPGKAAPRRLIPASLTERQRWLLVRNLSLAIVVLLLVYFLGHSGRWSFVRDLPAFLTPVLGDQNVVAFLAFGFLVLLGYAGARAQLAADAGLRRRLVALERKLALVRRYGGLRGAGRTKDKTPAALSGALDEVTQRLDAMERRIAALADDGPAKALPAKSVPAKSAGRPRHRQPPQRGAGS